MMPSIDARPVKLVRKRLDAAGLAAHLRSLAEHATEIELRIKSAIAQSSAGASDALDAAGRRLVSGELAAVQIRFFQDDAWWSDTLMRRGTDFRLVRMREGT